MIRPRIIFHSIWFLIFIAWLVLVPIDLEKYVSPANSQLSHANNNSNLYYPYTNLFVADMHADTLLWQRNFSAAAEIGHADLPRLRKVNTGLQVFMSVIEAPDETESDHIEQNGDQITAVALLDGWPLNTINNYLNRALFQSQRLHQAEKSASGKLQIVRYREQLHSLLPDWKAQASPLHAILGLEGAHATEFDRKNLQRLFDAGYRTMELAHYSDTALAGSSSGMKKYGLTDKGKEMLAEMQRLGMVLDVAHLSDQGIRDVLHSTDLPLFSSHTGVYSICAKSRNLSDDLIRQISARGGIIGIGFFEGALCDLSLKALVDTIVYAKNLVGSEYIALGSGWDAAELAISPYQLPELVRALQQRGLSETDVRNIMGFNVVRFFAKNLPSMKDR